MRKVTTILSAALLVSGIAAISGCDGKFSGPPGGSAVGTPGTDPLFGVTPFTFYAENPQVTGFYNDMWYIDPGRDSDNAANGDVVWYGDSIQALSAAGFTGWMINDPDPTHIEANNQYPLMLSFMSQWFHRNGDGSRIRELDQFGQLIWSPKSLDINFITAPVEFYVTPGPIYHYQVFRNAYPDGLPGSTLFTWSSPTNSSPGDFPPPQTRFLNKNYSECGVVLLTKLLPAGSPQLSQALGIAISDNADNENVENMGAIPQTQGGGFTSVPQPTGCFGDLFAIDYKKAAVIQPNTPGHEIEEAVIEYSRHFGSLNSNLVSKACGLNSGEVGTIMDPAQVIWQNGYAYHFVQNDLSALDAQHLPGKLRDPNVP